MLRDIWSEEHPDASDCGWHSVCSIACRARRFQDPGDACNRISAGRRRLISSTAVTLKATKPGGPSKAFAGTFELVAAALEGGGRLHHFQEVELATPCTKGNVSPTSVFRRFGGTVLRMDYLFLPRRFSDALARHLVARLSGVVLAADR